MTKDVDEALAFDPPTLAEVEASFGLLRRYFSPQSFGTGNLQTGEPTLLVGNHQRYGIDIPLLIREIYLHSGVYPRGLADRGHYRVPIWREMISRGGAALGSREMCRALMKAGETIMVYPGGAREVMKGKGKNYQLMWGSRMGFVRMAIEAGYSITPFCSVGADEAFDVIVDTRELMSSRLGKLLEGLLSAKLKPREDLILPVPRGIGLSAFPRPEKFYFAFGEPIQTAQYAGKSDDTAVQRCVRQKAAAAIEQLLAGTLLRRAQSSDGVALWRQVLNRTW